MKVTGRCTMQIVQMLILLFRLGRRRNFLTERVGKHWNRLGMEVVESPTLEVSQKHMDVALQDMAEW